MLSASQKSRMIRAAALSYDALKGPPHLALRHRMLGGFFKSLTVRDEEVAAVRARLRGAIAVRRC